MTTEQRERPSDVIEHSQVDDERQDTMVNEPQQQQTPNERLASLETAREYQDKSVEDLGEKVDAGFKEQRDDHKALDEKVDAGFKEQREKADTQFRWLVGLLILILLSVIGAGSAIVTAMVRAIIN